jgi:surfeit locus 1 family protein
VDFRQGRFTCTAGALRAGLPVGWQGGESTRGRPGFVARVLCPAHGGSPAVAIDLGWVQRATALPPVTMAAPVAGMVRDLGPRATPRYRLIVAAPAPPLQPLKLPTPDDIPNNHLSYAIQWFAFALTLLVIFAVYVRGWRRGG